MVSSNKNLVQDNTVENQQDIPPLIIIDDDAPDDLPIFEEIRHKKEPIDFVICLKIKDFYKLDFVGILTDYLRKISHPPTFIEQIVTVSQEAYSNALLWSSLDLRMNEKIRSDRFYDYLETRLKDPFYGDRFLGVYLTKNTEFIEIVFFIQGHPIVWSTETEMLPFKGTSIIRSYTHHFHIDENGKAIRLFFENNLKTRCIYTPRR